MVLFIRLSKNLIFKMPIKLLVSIRNDRPKSRSWKYFETPSDLAKELVDYYEEYLRTITSSEEPKEYKSDDLFDFLDDFFEEIVCLTMDNDLPGLWIPYGPSWIKEAIYMYFRSMLETEPTACSTSIPCL